MNKVKGGLGRGLDSLLGGSGKTATPVTAPVAASAAPVERQSEWEIRDVAPSMIAENPLQPRQHFDEEELESLANSIREHGILQPLVVTELPDGKYELVAGERRLRASRNIGLKKVPVVIRPALDDRHKLELALIENIQRHNLNPIEEALAYKALRDDFALRIEDIGKRVGKSIPAISNAMRLLDLPLHMLEAVRDGKIMRSHARTLLAEQDLNLREELFQRMLGGGVTVRQAEAVAGVRTNLRRRGPRRGKSADVAALENELREKLGTKVVLELDGTIGKLTVHFYSQDEMRRLINKLGV